MNNMFFQSFGSGSSGNCYYVGDQSHGILIDAGIGVRNIRKYLRDIGLDFKDILGVFITHDHADHIRAVGALGERYHIPIYSTQLIHEGINKNYCVTEKLKTCQRYIEKHQRYEIADFAITAFSLSHDSSECIGYFIEYQGKKITFATDLGCTNEYLAQYIQQSNYLVFEANYDIEMLKNGSYPPPLKKRIFSSTGHLSNDDCGKCLAENYRPNLSNVFLCHLSHENNKPVLAFETVNFYLEKNGIKVGKDLELKTLDRLKPSELYIF